MATSPDSAAQRAQLHKTIWNIADDLRGSVDGWDFKAYVLGTLFYRFISENLTEYISSGEHEAGFTDFDYANLTDAEVEPVRADMVKSKGFFILPSQLFRNVHAAKSGGEFFTPQEVSEVLARMGEERATCRAALASRKTYPPSRRTRKLMDTRILGHLRTPTLKMTRHTLQFLRSNRAM